VDFFLNFGIIDHIVDLTPHAKIDYNWWEGSVAALHEIRHWASTFYAPQLVPAGTAEARISYGNSVRLSVCLSVRLSQPGGIPSSGEIETPGLHHMIAWSI